MPATNAKGTSAFTVEFSPAAETWWSAAAPKLQAGFLLAFAIADVVAGDDVRSVRVAEARREVLAALRELPGLDVTVDNFVLRGKALGRVTRAVIAVPASEVLASVQALGRRGVRAAVPHESTPPLSEAQVRPWVLRPVYDRLASGQGEFLTELRPANVVFVRFEGIDYDEDEDAR